MGKNCIIGRVASTVIRNKKGAPLWRKFINRLAMAEVQLRLFYFSSPLHCKVTAYLPEKQCVSTEKVKYPRIFNEISMDT